MKLYMDGEAIEYEAAEDGFYKIGLSLNGRKCRVSFHTVPDWFMEGKSLTLKIKTGGHIYSWKRE